MRNARKWGSLAALALAATALMPAAAHAGSYNVYSCSIDGGFFGNGAWVASNNPAGDARYVTDTSCASSGDPLSTALAANNSFPIGTYAAAYFYAPSGTYISDFELVVHHYWYAPGLNPAGGQPDETTYNAVAIASGSNGVVVSGAGQFDGTQQSNANADGHWYGYRAPGSSGFGDSGVTTITRANSPRATAPVPQPTVMNISAGCWGGAPAACSLSSSASNYVQLFGSRVTIADDSNPALSGAPAGQGLRAPGTRSGGESVTFSASDNVGIRKAELVDVTDAANPTVVASKDYNSGTLTPQNERCDFTRPLPCPNVANDKIAADPPIGGHRSIILRVTDAAGNQTATQPFAIYARGPLNGVNGGDGAKLTAGFPAKVYRRSKKGKRYYTYVLRPSHTVSYGKSGALRGTLRNAVGQPIAGGQLRILVREARVGAQYVDRGAVNTDQSGRFSLGIPKGSSRTYQLAYKAYLGDDNLAARAKATLNTKARITATAARHVRAHGRVRFHGTLVGHPIPKGGVTLELQAFQPHRGWRAVATTRTRKGGRYSRTYRFNSGGGRFTFRIRLRPNASYPYARGTSRRLRVRVG